MKKIGLTMRVDVADTGEVRDALDCAWAAYLENLDFIPVYLSHRLEAESVISRYGLDALLLTGGNDVLEAGASYYAGRNVFESKLLEQAEERGIPVLGICRGMQMINASCGGSLSPIEGHVAQNHNVIFNGQDISVNSFHNYGIKDADLSDLLEVEAWAEDGSIEAFSHKHLPWYGVMWHPEREIKNAQFHAEFVQKILLGQQ